MGDHRQVYVLLREYYLPNDHVNELTSEDVLEQHPNRIDQSKVVVELSARTNISLICFQQSHVFTSRRVEAVTTGSSSGVDEIAEKIFLGHLLKKIGQKKRSLASDGNSA